MAFGRIIIGMHKNKCGLREKTCIRVQGVRWAKEPCKAIKMFATKKLR
jgi:hypothetical protein